MSKSLIEYKEWDSAFFKQEIYYADCHYFESMEEKNLSFPKGLVQTKIPAYCMHILDKAQQQGFVLAEMEVSFIYQLEKQNNQPLPIACEEDIPQITHMAAELFRYSRFRTPWFQTNDSSRLYAEWSKKAVLKQYDDVCLKIYNGMQQNISGFISARKLNHHTAQIGLIGVAQQLQGKNIGSSLLKGIEDWALTQQLQTILVSTQGSNQGACQFYLRNGYQLHAINYWFYKGGKHDSI